jgi:cytoskeletal protein CcmA (bactofilin family)
VLTGEIRGCDRLVVEGQVVANLDSRSMEIAASGVFRGTAHIDTAEISGRFEGDITVKQRLTVHATGCLIGTIRYCEIEIERGGILSGAFRLLGDETIEMPLAETSRSTERRSAASAAPARTTARQRTTPSSSR